MEDNSINSFRQVVSSIINNKGKVLIKASSTRINGLFSSTKFSIVFTSLIIFIFINYASCTNDTNQTNSLFSPIKLFMVMLFVTIICLCCGICLYFHVDTQEIQQTPADQEPEEEQEQLGQELEEVNVDAKETLDNNINDGQIKINEEFVEMDEAKNNLIDDNELENNENSINLNENNLEKELDNNEMNEVSTSSSSFPTDYLKSTYSVSKFNKSFYKGSETANDSKFLNAGYFPILAYTENGKGAVDWCHKTAGDIQVPLITVNSDQQLKDCADQVYSFIKDHKTELGIGHIDFKTTFYNTSIYPNNKERGGYSAGSAICVSVLSALKVKGACNGYAIIGQVLKNGNFDSVSGLEAKFKAARRVNRFKIIAPLLMKDDIEKLGPKIVKKLIFTYVDNIFDALTILKLN